MDAPTWLQHLHPPLESNPRLTAMGQHPPLATAEVLELLKAFALACPNMWVQTPAVTGQTWA